MNFKDFDKNYSRFLFGEFVSEAFPKIFFDESSPAVQKLLMLEEYIPTNSELRNVRDLTEKKRFGFDHQIVVKHMALESVVEIIKDNEKLIPVQMANKLISRADSFNRPRLALQLVDVMKETDWLKCFFNTWSSYDGCSLYIDDFKTILAKFSPETVMKTVFSKKEYSKWLDADDYILVYRGAFESCKKGLSWSTDIEVARKFANTYIDMKNFGLSYYRAQCQMPPDELEKFKNKFDEKVSIYSMLVPKKECIFINDRGEDEVFIPNSHLYVVEDCLP